MKNLATALLATALALPVSGCITLKATPHDFGCGGRLETYASTYPDTPLFAAIRRDAGQDFHDREPDTHGFGGEASLKPDLQQVLAQALVESADKENLRDPDAAPAMLLLSGGGGWGAFGAGFMQAWSHDSDAPMPRLAAVTGISTGALQGLFVASGRIDDMADTYAIQQQSELANERSYWRASQTGSLYDTRPLRALVESKLCPSAEGGKCSMLQALGRDNAPLLLIGMMEASSGDLRIVNITRMVREHTRTAGWDDGEQNRSLARCVAGIALASASVPAQLNPVRIDGKAYTDGGVRSSVFAALVGRSSRDAATSIRQKDGASAPTPQVFIIRNGPTVVAPDRKVDGTANVDARPDIVRIAGRSYSTIVNQNEVGSIALIRQIYPDRPILLATADGYNTPQDIGGRLWPKRDPHASDGEDGTCGHAGGGMVFDPRFMRCLVRWGRWKYANFADQGWIVIDQPEEPGTMLPSAPTRSSAGN